MIGASAVTERPRANQANRHDNGGSHEKAGLGSRMGKADLNVSRAGRIR
jgi:hypothetical protein